MKLTVLLADARDGQPLTSQEGPLRLVVPDEKRPARRARQVTTIRVASVVDGAVSSPGGAGADTLAGDL